MNDNYNPRQGLVEMLIDEWIANNPEEFAPGGEFEGVALEDGAQYDPYLDDFVVVGRKGSLIAITNDHLEGSSYRAGTNPDEASRSLRGEYSADTQS